MMGIGAGHQEDPNGIAWKQNKDFENLLKRLNGANGTGEEGQAGIVVDGFVKPTGSDDDEGNRPRDDEGKKENREKKDKKSRKKEKEDTTGEKKKKKRKRDEDAEDTDKKSRKKKKKSDDQPASEPDLPAEVAELASSSPDSTPTIEQNPRRVVPRHRSYVLLVYGSLLSLDLH
jgi:Pin2-interacting protein X1